MSEKINIRNPNLLDEHYINNEKAIRDIYHQLGNAKSAEEFDRLIEKMTTLVADNNIFLHCNNSATHRTHHKRTSHQTDKTHEEYVEEKKNLRGQILQALGGATRVGQAFGNVALLAAGYHLNIPMKELTAILSLGNNIANPAGEGLSWLAQASHAGHEATHMPIGHAVENLKQARQEELESLRNSSNSHEEAKRQRQKHDENKTNAIAAALSAMKGA